MQGIEPTEICAGDTVTWSRFVLGYEPAENWALTYYLQMGGQPIVAVPTTPDGSSHKVNVPGATSATWPAGQYAWKAVITGTGPNAGQRFTVDWGQLVMRPDPTQTYDPRSHARKCYEACKAVIEGRMSDPLVRYKIGDTEAFRKTDEELRETMAHYANILRVEAGRPLVTAHPVVLK